MSEKVDRSEDVDAGGDCEGDERHAGETAVGNDGAGEYEGGPLTQSNRSGSQIEQ